MKTDTRGRLIAFVSGVLFAALGLHIVTTTPEAMQMLQTWFLPANGQAEVIRLMEEAFAPAEDVFAALTAVIALGLLIGGIVFAADALLFDSD